MQNIPNLVGLILFSYLMGAVPWGWILTRLFTSVDIRQEGSGNIGATNVRRIAGAKLGALTLFADMMKGVIPVYIAGLSHFGPRPSLMIIAALSAFLGHLYPVFLRWKGGKGVAVTAGSFLLISPASFLGLTALFFLIVKLSRRVSMGSMGASLGLPLFTWYATGSSTIAGGSVFITAMILVRHRENIVRIVQGTEPRI